MNDVHQFRHFNIHDGYWSEWETISSPRYSEIARLIGEGFTYQLRILGVVHTYPSDEHVARYYKVKE